MLAIEPNFGSWNPISTEKKMLEQQLVFWLQARFREWLNLLNPGCRSIQNKSTKLNISKNMANKDPEQGISSSSFWNKYILRVFY